MTADRSGYTRDGAERADGAAGDELPERGMDIDGPILEQLDELEGVVKWFDPRKGFGFIVGPEQQDIFAHYTIIDGDGFRVLRDGSKVKYSAIRTHKGWKATKVERLDPPEVSVRSRGSYSRSPRRS